MVLVEIAVESLRGAHAAHDGGADRIELCADLNAGGLTPADEFTKQALADVDTPIFPMVRIRAGDFVYSDDEIADMCRTIERLRAMGVHGFVAGALTRAHEIDVAATERLIAAAHGLPFTFHRAFDRVRDQSAALEQLIELGVTRVLTSGGAATAVEGVAALRALVEQAAGRLVVLAGAGVRESNVRDVVLRAGVAEVHSRLSGPAGDEPTAERVRSFVKAAGGSVRYGDASANE